MKKTVHIYSYNIYKLFGEDKESAQGGAEFQLMTLGKMLSESGYSVTYLVGDFEQPDIVEKSGFRFVKIFKSNFNPFRKLLWLLSVLKKEKPQIIIERGSSDMVVRFALFSKLFSYRYFFCGASDINFSKNGSDPGVSGRTGKLLYNIGLKSAYRIVVQKKSQLDFLKKEFGMNGIVIPNFSHDVPPPKHDGKVYDVIWVSNIIPYKKPEFVFELAKQLPEHPFVMIGGSRDQNYYDEINKTATKIPNLTFKGFIPHNEVNQLISRSKVLINTTIVEGEFQEGFPNSFLQAWQYGVPVVSLISNPDEILEKFKIGFCSGNMETMKTQIQLLLENGKVWSEYSGNGKTYIENHHNNTNIIQQYISVISQ